MDAGVGVPRVVCCPHSGGSAAYFRSWQQLAPADVAVLAVQYPGRQDRLAEPFAVSVREIAEAVAVEISQQPSPVVLFGHSMGASVAYETARWLAATGVRLAGLVVSSHTPPAVPVDSDIHLRADDEMWRALAELGGTEPAILQMVDLREIFTPILRADLALDAAYFNPAAAGSLGAPILGLAGRQDVVAPPDSMLGWREVTTNWFDLRTFDGDHFYLQDRGEQVLHMVCELLSAGARTSRRAVDLAP